MYTAVIVLMVMSVSTATPDRPYSTMLRLENYLCSTITTERMSGLALMHVHKDIDMDAERIIHQFSHKKDRRIALLYLAPNESGCSNGTDVEDNTELFKNISFYLF